MMRVQGFELTKYAYNEMLRTYAGAMTHDACPENVKDTYIADSWRLLELIKKEKKVSIQILNSLLLVHCKALRPEQVEVKTKIFLLRNCQRDLFCLCMNNFKLRKMSIHLNTS